MRKFAGIIISVAILAFLTTGCKDKSSTTGWKYNDPKWGGFEKHEYKGQETGSKPCIYSRWHFHYGPGRTGCFT